MRNSVHDIGWKLMAVALAYILWLAVIEEKQALRQLEVPVRFDNQDAGLALVGERVSSVIVRVQAAEGIVKDLQPPDVDVVMDLAHLGEGSHTLRLRPDSPAIIPRRVGVRVVEVFPSQLRVDLERKVTADVPVEPTLTGQVAEGFEVTNIVVTPPFVRVIGPKSTVDGTTAAVTREVSIKDRRAPFEQDVVVDVESPDLVISGGPKARVAITIAEIVTERTLAGVAITALRGDYDARLRPNRTDLTLRGPERLLSRLKPSDVMVFADLKDLAPRDEPYELELQVVFSRDQFRKRIEVLGISEPAISVRVDRRRLVASEAGGANGG